ncbi:cytochrome P460 family protein [Methylocaldum sp.]|uniref:cytochrome P460 family protein n=1 Tax=Methylocaldum sp. TaxID=1969727 RepID=UPI002D559D61|nr:cytochrome P460 family protein [Methylocaldum sp.]HYE34618.1 cytochrome P460 family protein [Methylocaldum sp.]
MKKILMLLGAAVVATVAWAEQASVAPAPNGITIPQNYKDWRLIAVSQRPETGTLRAILGNDVAIDAARAGNTKPWPDGAVLAKLVVKQKNHPRFPTAMVPDEFVHAEFMIKDSAKFAATGGWGFARWLGEKQEPYGKDANFVQECVGCHTTVQQNDWVFTGPMKLP